MKSVDETILALSRGAAIAFAARCARTAWNHYTGKSPSVLEEAIAAAESFRGDPATLPPCTAINRTIKIAKADYEISQNEKDAANTYVAYAAFSALRSAKIEKAQVEAINAFNIAVKALRYFVSGFDGKPLENDLKTIVERDRSTTATFPTDLFDDGDKRPRTLHP